MAEDTSRYLEMSDEQLDQLIADHLLEGDFGAKDATPQEKQRIADSWFESKLSALRGAVCQSEPVRIYVRQSTPAEQELADAVVGALVYLAGGWPVPLALLAAKVIRYGLGRLCPELTVRPSVG